MVYVAYKYTQTEDKDGLKENLERLATMLEQAGKNTFILHRDKKNWGKANSSQANSLYFMIQALPKAGQVLAFVDHDKLSLGLWIELVAAKVLGKPLTLFIKKGVAATWIRRMTSDVYEFESAADLNTVDSKAARTIAKLYA